MGCRVGESNATLDNMNKEHDILLKKGSRIKIAIAMHLRSYRVVRQIDQSRPQPAQKFTSQAFYPGWRSSVIWPIGWWSATRRAALDMSRPGACKRWGRKFT
jgi:hypothetical protein